MYTGIAYSVDSKVQLSGTVSTINLPSTNENDRKRDEEKLKSAPSHLITSSSPDDSDS